ncbi:MAG: hypothetical protein WEC75_06950 [Dehalococcoidia bacterium]
MDGALCHACHSELDSQDNFCRRCGVAMGPAGLPAVRGTRATTVWQPNVSPVVKGAAMMAAGTVGQFMFRRLVSGLLGGGKQHGARARALHLRPAHDRDGLVDEAQIVTEMVTLRRVRIRRQA